METTPNSEDPNLSHPGQQIQYTLAPVLFKALYAKRYSAKQTGPPPPSKSLFPGSIVRQGLLIIPEEYILVEKDENLQLYKLGEGGVFTLDVVTDNVFGKLNRPKIKIIKNRRCVGAEEKGGHGRTLLLVRSTVSLDPLSLLPDNTELPLLSRGKAVGKIHPGQGDFTGSGHENAQGRGHENAQGRGHTNCYGSAIYDDMESLVNSNLVVTADRLNTSECAPIVAVLDTGIIYTEESPEKQELTSCRTNHTGWNFVDPDTLPQDDHPHHHGTRIATIIRQQSPKASIVPVKVSNQDNVCTLYDVLCGLEYSRVIGAKVINASWSFPASSETPIPLLRAAIERFDGWFVCAAGNTSQYFPDVSNHGNPLPLGADNHYLYPACYSCTIDKVITVTTAITFRLPDARACPAGERIKWLDVRQVTENRSNLFVDVGVIANAPLPGSVTNRGFLTRGFSPSDGSSFATPCITGAVADLLVQDENSSLPVTNHALLKKIAPKTDAGQLGKDIKDGRFFII
jgi:hypothetical protein